ncbi:hypothetical protein [Pedobacter psychroterrae]|uniref:hypothetical protein n=1 Tax=Pedobacter psychroterrae TaxID=2530453 RepID=UPI0013F14CB5|nr:hypothetical protein [Pedobacter psychroterrae]
MFKQFLDQADGHQGYMIASLAIFFVFFITVAVLLLVMKKDTIKYMSNLPLEDEQ